MEYRPAHRDVRSVFLFCMDELLNRYISALALIHMQNTKMQFTAEQPECCISFWCINKIMTFKLCTDRAAAFRSYINRAMTSGLCKNMVINCKIGFQSR